MSIERKRHENEKKFGNWTELPPGGRCYVLEVPGLHGWTARYVKEVDSEEQTIRFSSKKSMMRIDALWKFTRSIRLTKGTQRLKGDEHDTHSANRRSEARCLPST